MIIRVPHPGGEEGRGTCRSKNTRSLLHILSAVGSGFREAPTDVSADIANPRESRFLVLGVKEREGEGGGWHQSD